MAEYIRREDALAVIRKYYPRSYAGTFVYRDIADLPAVCVAETGEVEGWIYDDYGYARCACCGWEWDVPETVTPYCPNCGAHMEDDEEADRDAE